MQIKRLTITNVRVFERAEFDFQPGMNLLVGINGAGKSTVLGVLRTMLSQILPDFTSANRRSIARYFDKDTDISIGSGFLTAEMLFIIEPEQSGQQTLFEIEPIHLHHLIHIPREEFIVDESRKGEVRHQTVDLEERSELKWVDEGGSLIQSALPFQALKKSQHQPIVVFFSPHRSVVESKRSPAGGQSAAFADALEDRALYLNEFALWWRTREELAKEDKSAQRLLEVLNETVATFLDGCSDLHVLEGKTPSLWVRKNGNALNVSQLSDGERSMLALVFDLSRRLALANPLSDDPLRDGRGVVLIDELDLHLHPSWQRTIVDRLTTTFPNCQFIATTHSPQILGEVPPDRITIIEDGEVSQPFQSFGVDSNRILKYVMNASPRNKEIEQALKQIEQLIEDEEYEKASDLIEKIKELDVDLVELASLQAKLEMFSFLDDENDEDE